LLAWEMTRACTLACPHCRAAACADRHPDELTTAEGLRLLREAAEVGPGIIIFSGGEPLLRPDLEELAAAAGQLGHVPVVATNDGLLLDERRIASLISAGVRRFSFSVHFPDEASADTFTCRPGSYVATLEALARLQTHGMSFQINTTVMPGNHQRLAEMREWALARGAAAWHLFFVVPTGRARVTGATVSLEQDQIEDVLTWAAALADDPRLPMKITCAPQYARIRAQAGHPPSPFGRSCMAGDGFAFVSWQGEVKPCGYFDLIVGTIREQSFAELYRDAPAFRALRSPDLLEGACGACTYRAACGGCRARALAVHGSMLGPDPNCPLSFQQFSVRPAV
jgi:AdoMet-dependent heme synthase